MARRKLWSESIEAHGVRIRIYEREPGGRLYCELRGATHKAEGKKRKSLGHSNKTRARTEAKIIAKHAAEARLLGRQDENVTLGMLFALYRKHHLPTLTPARQQEAEARIQMFTEAWGRDLPSADIDAVRARTYCTKRRSLEIVAPGLRLDQNGKRRRGYREPKPARDGALDAEFRWLNSVLNWACGFKRNGNPLLTSNPIPNGAKQRRAFGWPVEQNPRRPVASHQRFTATMEHVDTVDPAGRLGCILSLARWTGRRESAICQLRANDLLLSEDRIRAALAAAGMDERLVEHMPNGAIRWASEPDKQGFLFISPINRPGRDALDAYLRRAGRVGNIPLFPAPRAPDRPISRDLAAKWLARAECLAGLPKLKGGVFHPFRRLWASERKTAPTRDVAAAGGWRDDQALRRMYQQPDPASVLRAVQHGAD